MFLTPQIGEINKIKWRLGYTTSNETIKYSGEDLIAFGSLYYDFRTGHKYFKILIIHILNIQNREVFTGKKGSAFVLQEKITCLIKSKLFYY